MSIETPFIRCVGVSKNIGRKTVLDGFSYSIGSGAHALIGKNGVGKSTLLSILAGIVRPDGGEIHVNGHDLEKNAVWAKRSLSFVPDKPAAYDFMSGQEFLNLILVCRHIKHSEELSELLDQFGLRNFLHKPFGQMSFGVQRKFSIVAGLIGNPNIVLMDEPSNGLDQRSHHLLIEYINRHKQERLFVFATHDSVLIENTSAKIRSLDVRLEIVKPLAAARLA